MPTDKSAAATVSPANPCARRPSIVKAIVSPAASGSLRNMKPPSTKGKKVVGETSGGDLRRDVKGMVCRQRYAGVAGHEKRAGMCCALIINRKAVLTHHAQRRPDAHHVEACEHRKHTDGAMCHRGGDWCRRHVLESHFFEAVADHH